MSAKSKKCPAQHLLYFERTFRKWNYFLSEWACFLISKHTNFIKTCFFFKKKLRGHAYICVNI